MNQDRLRLPRVGLKLGDDVRLTLEPVGDVREELLVQKPQRLEIQTRGDFLVEELEELPRVLPDSGSSTG
jgi:hypothetical protein